MSDPLRNIVFVLVRTCFASNLGSTVRVMKNMGFRELILVQPLCEVGIEARSFAMKGADILDRARFLPSLEAVQDELGILVGTTGRLREGTQRLIDCPTFARDVLPDLAGRRIGMVFGSEDNGLRREELRLCQWLVSIPTAREYPVMNLAQAAAVVAYQLRLELVGKKGEAPRSAATPEQVESLLERTQAFLENARLSTRVSVPRLMARLQKIAARSRLEREDVNMLHGLLKELERRLEREGRE
ncbi:MAG: RNA methyltransferase [Acidobacteriota bacterium]